MRLAQDLCIAIVLAVVGGSLGKAAPSSGGLAVIEGAMALNGLSEADAASVRELISEARQREKLGDERGAVTAMAQVTKLLGIA